jgi:hypothetical protein
MSYTYATFSQALAAYMAVPNNNVADTQFVAMLPSAIDSAEERCYQDLDLISLTSQPQAFPATATKRLVAITAQGAAPQIMAVERVGIYAGSPVALNACAPVSMEWLDLVYGDQVTGLPRFYAMRDDVTIALGPNPDQAYSVTVVGKASYTPLSANNTTTWLTQHVPALFLAAAMINATGFQRNFGAQADDPRSAMSWLTEYNALLPRAQELAMRQRQHGWMQVTAERSPPPTQPGSPGPPP